MDPNDFSRDQSLMGPSDGRGHGRERGRGHGRGGNRRAFRGRGSAFQVDGGITREPVDPPISHDSRRNSQQQDGQHHDHDFETSSHQHRGSFQSNFHRRGRGRDNFATHESRSMHGDQAIHQRGSPSVPYPHHPGAPPEGPRLFRSSIAHRPINQQSHQQHLQHHSSYCNGLARGSIQDTGSFNNLSSIPLTTSLPFLPQHRSTDSHPPYQPLGTPFAQSQPAHAGASHVPSRTNIAGESSISAGKVHSLQSLPLNYVFTNGTPEDSKNIEAFAEGHSKSVATILGTPFGRVYTLALENLVTPFNRLEEFGYKTEDFTEQELLGKRRCEKCNKPFFKVRKAQENKLSLQAEANLRGNTSTSTKNKEVISSAQSLSSSQVTPNQSNSTKRKQQETAHICRFHSGGIIRSQMQSPKQQASKEQSTNQQLSNQQLSNQQASGPAHDARSKKIWSCCRRPPNAEPCAGNRLHTFVEVDIKWLEEQYQYHPTPPANLLHETSYRLAVALDCEMGMSKIGGSKLIRVTMIDYHTSEVLIDKLVYPNVPMSHLNTKYSGVTWDMLNSALARKDCFHSELATLHEVWKFVTPETVVVAHSGTNDLNSLHWRHPKVVDTFLLEWVPEQRRQEKLLEQAKQQEASEKEILNKEGLKKEGLKKEPSKPTTDPPTQEPGDKIKRAGPFSLKHLTKQYLQRNIQTGSRGHDSLEDAIATRDLAHWHVRHSLEGKVAMSDAAWFTE